MKLIRGTKYVEDVELLREYNGKNPKGKKYPRKYKKLFDAILKQYGISEKTLYRDMNQKATPGLRRKRSDSKEYAAILKSVVKYFCEELSEKKPLLEVINECKIKFNFKFDYLNTNHIMAKVKEKKPELFVGDSPLANMKHVLREIFKMNKEEIENFRLRLIDKEVNLTADDLNDITLILSNAYNRHIRENKDKLAVDRIKLFEARQFNILEEAQRKAEESGNAADLKRINDIYLNLKRKSQIQQSDLDVIIKLVKLYDPTADENTILAQIEDLSKEGRND